MHEICAEARPALDPVLGLTLSILESFFFRPHARAAAFIFSFCSRVCGVAVLPDGFAKPYSAIHEICAGGEFCSVTRLSAETSDGNMTAIAGTVRRSRCFFIYRTVAVTVLCALR